MNRLSGYFRLQLKRFFKLTPIVLLLSALLLGAIGTAMFGLLSDKDSDDEDSLVSIGIVGDMTDSYLGMAVSALQNQDSSRFSLSVRTISDESDAAAMLSRGELAAYIIMPDNFIAEAIDGDLKKITCVTSAGATDFGTQVSNELMQTVTRMVMYSQKGIFGFQNAAMAYGVPDGEAYDMGDDVSWDIIDYVLDREKAYDIIEVGTDGVDRLPDPLICGMLMLLIMLWGITCCTIFNARNKPLRRVLSAKGTGAAAQVAGEYGAYLVFMTAMLGVLSVVIVAASPFFPTMSSLEKYDFTRLLPGILLPILTISALQFFLYEVSGGLVTGALLQFFCAMGMGYISGCVYPAYFFPEAVQSAAALLPSWSCRVWLDELLAGRASLGTIAVLIGYFAVFLLLTVVIRRERIKREGGTA